jgi:hypothetical protein
MPINGRPLKCPGCNHVLATERDGQVLGRTHRGNLYVNPQAVGCGDCGLWSRVASLNLEAWTFTLGMPTL